MAEDEEQAFIIDADQPLVDRFLAADKYNPKPVIEMLRDMLWMGYSPTVGTDRYKRFRV